MSEETTVAAPEAPTVVETPTPTPEPVAPAPPDQAKSAPRTKSDFRRAAAERAKRLAQAREQPREPAGKPEGGQFTSEQAKEAEPATEVVTDEVPTEPVQAAETAKVPALPGPTDEQADAHVAPAPSLVKIPLRDDDPLRSRGMTEIEVPAQFEREYRNLLNRANRSIEADRLAEQNRILEAKLEALSGDMPAQLNDPTLQHLLTDIEQSYSPKEAELIKRALHALNNEALHKVEAEAAHEARLHQAGREFVYDVQRDQDARFPVWAQTGELRYRVSDLLLEYGNNVERRNQDRQAQGLPPILPTAQEFWPWAGRAYVADPRVKQAFEAKQKAEREREAERIRAEERKRIAEEEKQKLQEAAGRHAAVPPGTGSHKTTGNAIAAEADEARRDALRSQGSRKRAVAKAIRDRYAER